MADMAQIPASLRSLLGGRATAVPAQYTNDAAVRPTASQLKELAKISKSGVHVAAAFANANAYANGEFDSDEVRLICEIRDRKAMLEPEHARLRDLYRRMDNLYFPEVITDPGGADHWPPEKPNTGRVHVSLNNPPNYVTIPAALKATIPTENYAPASPDEEDRATASRAERLYFQWKDDLDFELLGHKALITAGLYGHTFGKVYWDSIEKIPAVTVLESPENLYVGWGDSDFRRMDWAIYCYGLSPQSAAELYDVDVEAVKVEDGRYEPYVSRGTHADPLNQQRMDPSGGRLPTAYEDMQVEVYDYWYRVAQGGRKRPAIWNAIFVGNMLVEHKKHSEYDDLPYIALPNSFIPGYPYGRPDLYDLEQIFREKDERLSEAGQMIHSAVGGQMWQLVGSEAPDDVPPNAMPRPNKVATPGANAEIKTINPFLPSFPVEEYLKRLDYELEGLSGLNEMLMGRAPLTALGSSKAISALVANYALRMMMGRDLYYQWRKRIWKVAAKLWERKDSDIKAIIDGQYSIVVTAPDLTPRDHMENAQRVISLVQNRLISMERAMDEMGVDDPETEKDVIRAEQTDPALNPAAVNAQMTLAASMQAMGVEPGAAPGGQSATQNENTARTLNRPQKGSDSLNAPENQSNAPGEAIPSNARLGGAKAQVQTMVTGGEATGRVLTQTPIGGE